MLVGAVAAQNESAELTDPPTKNPTDTERPREPVKLPGLLVDFENDRVDVTAKVCLKEGLLELVACIEDTKEHESLVVVEASPKLIHAALLMIGAKNGSPARVKPANEEKTRWVHLPPRGDPITVSLVIEDDNGKQIERPIGDFIKRRADAEPNVEPAEPDGEQPSDPIDREAQPAQEDAFDKFLFAGSLVLQEEQAEKRYLADESGNVVSISTFGDEVLCLPSRVSDANDALIWEVDSTHLPKVGTEVVLRLSVAKKPQEENDE